MDSVPWTRRQAWGGGAIGRATGDGLVEQDGAGDV